MVCLDTSFLVDLIRGNREAVRLLDNFTLKKESIAITSPSIMEVISGASMDKSARQEKEKIFNILSSLRILDLGKIEATRAGEIHAELVMEGNTIGEIDVMIAAICLENKETLVTKNKKHFEKIRNLKVQSY